VTTAGDIVTQDDLISRIWPRASVEENTLQVHIASLRRVLGADCGLLKTMSGRGYRLLGDWRVRSGIEVASGADPPAAANARSGNLPIAVPALIGRASEFETICALLSAYRVVTLAGPGGIGKTPLAVEAAKRLAPGFAGARSGWSNWPPCPSPPWWRRPSLKFSASTWGITVPPRNASRARLPRGPFCWCWIAANISSMPRRARRKPSSCCVRK
jgi:hypothetical protein